MTAVVGILNKQAVAIAADSAVTIGGTNGRKILNQANKVFALSKYHPVGIMIFNSASFMGTPWETIIKVYRKELGDHSFPTLQEYQADFIKFIRANNFYTDAEMQLAFLENFAGEVIWQIVWEVIKSNRKLVDIPTDSHKAELLELLKDQFEEVIQEWEKSEVCDEFADYTFNLFEAYSQSTFSNVVEEQFTSKGIDVSEELFERIKKAVYMVLRAKEKISGYTGLIFCGFGDKEIYPSLIPVNISMVVDHRLRYHIMKEAEAVISNENLGAVMPFAQTDVIDTILSGIDPSLDDYYLKHFHDMLTKYNQAILNSIGSESEILREKISRLQTEIIVDQFNEMNQRVKFENYIKPLMGAVSTLSKEDLAEMAESLIYLTYLKRRITFAEESVGGPIDVAIISKGDGFIWIKRKHYFKPELNQHFFDNYFKK